MYYLCLVTSKSKNPKLKALQIKFIKNLVNLLSLKFKVLYSGKNYSFLKGKGKPLFIFDADNYNKIRCPSCILLFCEKSHVQIPIIKSKKICAIISSSESNTIKNLLNKNIPVMTFGPTVNDTVTYSSCTDDNIMVCLQNSVSSFKGHITEPFEMPIKRRENDDIYAYLAYLAICSKIDETDKNYL